ncbi:MAG: hypothetical protein WDN23_06140 [Edaphobacter sp.]
MLSNDRFWTNSTTTTAFVIAAEAASHATGGGEESAANSRLSRLESTTLTIDGKAKQPKQSICHYSTDGQLIKSPIGESTSPQISGGPLKQHIIKKKI